MKYPKLWNGTSPVGEALVRALQRTGAPFLSAHTADGVYAGVMNGLSEVKVKEGGPGLCLSWWEWSPDLEDPFSLGFIVVNWALLDLTTLRVVRRGRYGPHTLVWDDIIEPSLWGPCIVAKRDAKPLMMLKTGDDVFGNLATMLADTAEAPRVVFNLDDIVSSGYTARGFGGARHYKGAYWLYERREGAVNNSRIARWPTSDSDVEEDSQVRVMNAASTRVAAVSAPVSGSRRMYIDVSPWGIASQPNEKSFEWFDMDSAYALPKIGSFDGLQAPGTREFRVMQARVGKDFVSVLAKEYPNASSSEPMGTYVLFRERYGDAPYSMQFESDQISLSMPGVLGMTATHSAVFVLGIPEFPSRTIPESGAAFRIQKYSMMTGELVKEKDVPLRAANDELATFSELYEVDFYTVW